MEVLLSKVTQQAMNYAIRSGITITSGYALRQCSRLLKSVEGDDRSELATLQLKLKSKIQIISPAIDMIELIAARGNTTLESAVTLTKALRWDIQSLGNRLATAAADEELIRRAGSRAKSRNDAELEVKSIIVDIKTLLSRIEDAVPMINLAITTSGANLSTSLPATVSPSRLLQASTFLTAGDTQYTVSPSSSSQVGPAFTLTMYMLFEGYARDLPNATPSKNPTPKGRDTVWKEVMHKARVKLLRVPLDNLHEFPSQVHDHSAPAHSNSIPGEGKSHEFAYQILIIEDLNDDRVHTVEEGEASPESFEDVAQAGLREIIPIHEISKIFYADTGKILSIGTEGESNNPILLLKRDIHAIPPRRMMERQAGEQAWYEDASAEEEVDEEQSEIDAQLHRESSVGLGAEPEQPRSTLPSSRWRLPPDLDPEWIALEVYVEQPDSDSESEPAAEDPSSPVQAQSPASSLNQQMQTLHLQGSSAKASPAPASSPPHPDTPPTPATASGTMLAPQAAQTSAQLPALRTSLSLLEMLIRLTALQQFQQTSHLAIPDELLTFFLSESSSTGAGADQERRKMLRNHARYKVGFDPYDESPVKFHGEEYQRAGNNDDSWDSTPYERSWYGYDGYSRAGSVDPNAPLPSRETFSPGRPSSAGVGAGSPLLRKMGPRSRGGTPERMSERGPGTPGSRMRGSGGAGVGSPLVREVGKRSSVATNPAVGNDSALGTSPAIHGGDDEH